MKKRDIAVVCLFVFFAGLAAGYAWRFKQVSEGQKENRARIEALEKKLKEIQDLGFNIQKGRKYKSQPQATATTVSASMTRDGRTDLLHQAL